MCLKMTSVKDALIASKTGTMYIFFGCPSISTISAHLGMSAAVSASDEDIWRLNPPHGLDDKLWPSVLLTTLWRLWDARNGEAFQNERSSLTQIISRVIDDLTIWRKRFILKKAGSSEDIQAWLLYVQNCRNQSSVTNRLPITSV